MVFQKRYRQDSFSYKKLPGGTELDPETVKEQKENKNTYDELVAKKAEDKIKQEAQEQKQ